MFQTPLIYNDGDESEKERNEQENVYYQNKVANIIEMCVEHR
jgi:hypothetical protein